METLILLLGVGIIGGIIFVIYKLSNLEQGSDDKAVFEHMESLRNELRESGSASRKETQQLLGQLDDRLAKGLGKSSETLQKQFAQSTQVIQEVTKKLTQLDETNKQVKDFASQMQSLENILKNPKQRGILGEYFLETLLGEVLQPNQYKMQYKFPSGEIVDAAVFMKDKVIPIDAKFSLEKYNKIMEEEDKARREQYEKEFKADIKKRIDETSKYIQPEQNTTDFAFMFIPAEGIYYNLLIYKENQLDVKSADLIEYAFKKHVIIVSPTSFYAYLETVLQGLKAMQMEDSVREIIKEVDKLGRHLGSYEEYMQKMGGHLGTTVGMYNNAYKEFKKIDKDVYKITGGESGGKAEALLVDKPTVDV